MKNTHDNRPINKQCKDKVSILKYTRKRVEKGTKMSLKQLKSKFSEEQLFYVALQFVTTTKKALCKALDINIDNACRYKRSCEKSGLLVQSADEIHCPFTGFKAHLISTNPNEFEKLLESNFIQLKLF